MSLLQDLFKRLTQSIIEARRKKAAYDLARILSDNPDFRSWSFHELYHCILDKDCPVSIGKKPVGNP